MVKKKRGSSSPVAPKKSVTPKVSFKKITSPKKKRLTPFNKLILKKSNESKNSGWPSQGNIVEDEIPREVSKEKKKKNPSEGTMDPKSEITKQEKNKKSYCEKTKNVNITNGTEELVSDEPPKKKKPVKTKKAPKNLTKIKKEGNIKTIPKTQSSKVKGLSTKLKPDKHAKKIPVKASSSLDKSAKMTKKPVKTIPKKDTKGKKRKETGDPEVLFEKNKMLSSAQESQPSNSIANETHPDSCSQEPKVNENYPVPDIPEKSSSPEELSELIVNETYPAPDSLEMSRSPEELPEPIDPDDAEDEIWDNLRCSWDQRGGLLSSDDASSNSGIELSTSEIQDEAASNSVTEDNLELRTSENQDEPASNSVLEENTELNASEIQDEPASNSVLEENTELNASEIQDEAVSDIVIADNIELNTSENLDEAVSDIVREENIELKISENLDEAASNSVLEENTELNASEIQGEHMVSTKMVIQEVGQLEESESQESSPERRTESRSPVKRPKSPGPVKPKASPGHNIYPDRKIPENNLIKEKEALCSSPLIRLERTCTSPRKTVQTAENEDEAPPGRGGFGMFLTPEKESLSPKRSTIEDDLCLSSDSQCSLRRSVSLGSVDEHCELKKVNKNLAGPLVSELPLKRRKDATSIDKFSTSSSQCSSTSSVSLGSFDGCYELGRKKSKNNLAGPLPSKLPLKRKTDVASIDDIQPKRKCLDSKESSSSPNDFLSHKPDDHPRRCEEGHSLVSPQHHHRGLESPSSMTSEHSSGLSPSKTMKVIVKRIDVNEYIKPRTVKGNERTLENSVPRIPFEMRDCTVSLTKIDCDMEDFPPTSPLKVTTSISSKNKSNTNNKNYQEEKQSKSKNKTHYRTLSNTHIIPSNSQSINNLSPKDGSKALSSIQSSVQKARTYPAKCRSPDNSLQKEKKKFSVGINDHPFKKDSRTSDLSGFSIRRSSVSTIEVKPNSQGHTQKPKMCKTDLIRKNKQLFKTLCTDKSKPTCNYANKPANSTVDSTDMNSNRTIQPMGNFPIPVRKIINKNTAKSESSAESPFKQPQVNPITKVHKKITFENNESTRNKPSTGNIEATPNESPLTQTPKNHKTKNMILWKTQSDYSVSSRDILPQLNEYSEKKEDDIMSISVNDDLEEFFNGRIELDGSTKTNSFIRGIPGKNRISFSEDLLAKPSTAAQDTFNSKQDINNGYAKVPQNQMDVFCPTRSSTNGGCLKSSRNQLVNISNNRDRFSLHDEDQEQGQEYVNQKGPKNRNKEVEYRNHNQPDFMPHSESGFQPARSISNSSLTGSNNLYGFDNIAYENQLRGTPFDGFCLFYLRSSVAKNQDHQCDLRHEVPGLLFHPLIKEDNELKRSTSRGIHYVCKENCNNPPPRLLEGITVFCIRNDQKQELSNVICFLKNSITEDKVGREKYKAIWAYFTKALVKNLVLWNTNPPTSIDLFLRKIILDENGQICGEAIKSVLYDVLHDLAKMANTPSLKLLHSVSFLKEMKCPVVLYPINFIEAVLSQVLRQVQEVKSLDKGRIGFVYLVYRTFFDNMDDCRYIYKESRVLTEEFLTNGASIIGPDVKHKLNLLQNENGPVIERTNHWGQMNRRPIDTAVPQQQRYNFVGVNNVLDMPKSQARLIEKMTPKEVFDLFKEKSVLSYLELLQKCENALKRKCNDVTMSFILLESDKEDSWHHCYSLFQEMIEFDPRIVKDFINENMAPARRLLVIINCCLKSYHIQDAVALFLRFGLYEVDHSKWLVEKSPEEEDLYEKVCEDFKSALLNLPQFTETEAQLFTAIIQHQKSLRAPIYLQKSLNNFFWKAANLRAEGGWNAMATIVSTIAEENLLKQLNLDKVELYRILIRAVCATENLSHTDANAYFILCARLMKKSNSVCDIYPTSWARDCNMITVKTCLTVEELYAFFVFKIRAFKKLIEQKSFHITFEEYDIDTMNWKQPYFQEVDSSIKGAIERFKLACRRIGLEPTSLIIHKNKITLDKVILQETQL